MRRLVLVSLLFISVLTAPPAGAQRPAARAGSSSGAERARFLEMFARGYFPGRTAQLMIVPKQGDILTRADPELPYMHGSPWRYDTAIPLMFVGPGVKRGVYPMPAVQQDVAVTLASVLGVAMPPTATGHVLPVVRQGATPPRAVFLLVLDGMRRDYFDQYAKQMPTLSALRQRSAWFSNARVNYLPTNTAAGHSSIATGAEPRVHGVTGNNLFDRAQRKRHDMFQGWDPRDLVTLTLADVWQLETAGRAIVIAQGSSAPSSTALAGHGACQVGGSKVFHAGYDETVGFWKTDADCFTLSPELASLNAKTLWPADGMWMGHKIDTPAGVRRSGLFPRFETDAFVRVVESQRIGEDDVPDLLLLNFKGADYVGHKHGPGSPELVATLAEMDRLLARILKAVESKVGSDYVLAVTADHGMPGEPADPKGRHFAGDIVNLIHEKFDPEKKLVTYYEPENSQIFIDMDRLAALKLSLDTVAAFLRAQPFMHSAFTEDEVRTAAATLTRTAAAGTQ